MDGKTLNLLRGSDARGRLVDGCVCRCHSGLDLCHSWGRSMTHPLNDRSTKASGNLRKKCLGSRRMSKHMHIGLCMSMWTYSRVQELHENQAGVPTSRVSMETRSSNIGGIVA